MILLLSPAKSLNLDPVKTNGATQPRFLEDSQKLVDVLKKKSVKKLKNLMKISDKIAELNVERYNSFQTPFTKDNAKAAIHIFAGDVYTGLQADTFNAAELKFAQKHLRILSGLYGLLRPLDLMQAYRLEMGTSLKNGRKKNLYDFWGTKITEIINQDLKTSGTDIVLNLASKEYFSAVKMTNLEGSVVTVDFKEDRNGVFKVISFNAKKARGAMANKIIKKGITDVNKLKKLTVDGYKFNKNMSEDYRLVFTKMIDLRPCDHFTRKFLTKSMFKFLLSETNFKHALSNSSKICANISRTKSHKATGHSPLIPHHSLLIHQIFIILEAHKPLRKDLWISTLKKS